MNIAIRHAEPGDFIALHAIYACPKVIAGTLQPPFPSTETWRKRLAEPPPDTVTLIAEADGRLAGHLGIFPAFRPRRGHAAGICLAVHDSFAGRGIGTALLREAVALADGWLNLQRLELTVFTDNAQAIRLYEKFGFVREGTHRAFALRDGYLVDAFAMARLKQRELEEKQC